MSESPANRETEPTPAAGVSLRRCARHGFTAGGLLAAAIFGFFAFLPGTTRPLGLYVGLAVVLGVTAGLLATIVLVGWRAYRLPRAE